MSEGEKKGEWRKEADKRDKSEHFLKMRLYKLVTIVEKQHK